MEYNLILFRKFSLDRLYIILSSQYLKEQRENNVLNICFLNEPRYWYSLERLCSGILDSFIVIHDLMKQKKQT